MGPMGNSQLSSENKSVHISSQDTNVHPPPHSFSKLISSFLSTMHLRLLHFWVFPLLPGLFVQVVLDGKHAVYSNLQIKKKILLGHPGVAIGKFTTLELHQCQTRVHLRWIMHTVTFWDLRYYQSYSHLRCLC